MERSGFFLQRWRLDKKVSQFALADQCGVSQRHISFIENAKAKPSRPTLLALCRVLEIPDFETERLLRAYGLNTLLPQGRANSNRVNRWIDQVPSTLNFACVILDEQWNIAQSNLEFDRLITAYGKTPSDSLLGTNFLDLFFSPAYLCGSVRNADVVGMPALSRAIREVKATSLRSDQSDLLDRLNHSRTLFVPHLAVNDQDAIPPVIQLVLANDTSVESFTVVLSTLGTEFDWHRETRRMAMFIPANP
ncbi:MAG: helix-turn-helix transcriptional regulator [Burkholderiales bacterium]|nr:helix-turn-helix transcriptional regulator [Burkholderiales bacterium]